MTPKDIFINSAGRLRSGWRLLVFVAVLFAFYFVFAGAFRILYALAVEFVPSLLSHPLIQEGVFRVLLLFMALGAGYVCCRWLEGLPWRSLGLTFHEHWFRDLVVGSAIGLAALALATLIATAGRGLSFTVSPRNLLPAVISSLLVSAALFICAALAEEALFRGYVLQTLTRANLAWVGVLLTSVPFAAAHLGNPHSVALASLNTGLAGVWLAAAYLRTRSLWFPLGVHWAWNWALGSLFGLPVSGMTTLVKNPLLHGSDLGPAWLTGGSYGIEGGVACTVALIASTIFIWKTRLVNATAEQLRLTSVENPSAPPLSIIDHEAS